MHAYFFFNFPAVTYNWRFENKDHKINYIYTDKTTPHAFISSNGNLYFSEVTSFDKGYYYCQADLSGLTKSVTGSTQPPSKTSLKIKLDVKPASKYSTIASYFDVIPSFRGKNRARNTPSPSMSLLSWSCCLCPCP